MRDVDKDIFEQTRKWLEKDGSVGIAKYNLNHIRKAPTAVNPELVYSRFALGNSDRRYRSNYIWQRFTLGNSVIQICTYGGYRIASEQRRTHLNYFS